MTRREGKQRGELGWGRDAIIFTLDRNDPKLGVDAEEAMSAINQCRVYWCVKSGSETPNSSSFQGRMYPL